MEIISKIIGWWYKKSTSNNVEDLNTCMCLASLCISFGALFGGVIALLCKMDGADVPSVVGEVFVFLFIFFLFLGLLWAGLGTNKKNNNK